MIRFSCPAKWILCGEHAVVRGGKALAFPFNNYTNSIVIEKSAKFSLVADENLKETALSAFEAAAKFLNISLNEISNRVVIQSDIPMEVGLGSSAALCVNVARFFEYSGLLKDVFELAKYLENLFHGKSSGLDVSTVLENKPIIFGGNKVIKFLEPNFWPHMRLTYSGEKSKTFDCANIIKKIFLQNEKLALELDERMNFAANLCEEALEEANFNKLKDGVACGGEIFREWGLCSSSMLEHMKELLSSGAAAVKPIGSGMGGYILSLWNEKPAKYEDNCLTLKKP